VDPRAGLDGYGEQQVSCPQLGLESQTFQLLASCHTDYVNPAPCSDNMYACACVYIYKKLETVKSDKYCSVNKIRNY
jgi:hypothetical protein